MPTAQEKAAFSERLKLALRKSNCPVKGATDLARLFNLQYCTGPGIGISVQAAHKWLNGYTIPTADKIKALTEWLGVSEHWLTTATPNELSQNAERRLPSSAMSLLEQIKALTEYKRHFVKELVRYLTE